jgi:hypothetical protein
MITSLTACISIESDRGYTPITSSYCSFNCIYHTSCVVEIYSPPHCMITSLTARIPYINRNSPRLHTPITSSYDSFNCFYHSSCFVEISSLFTFLLITIITGASFEIFNDFLKSVFASELTL